MKTTVTPELDIDEQGPAPSTGSGPGPGPGLGIYIHWPFCASKCPYCDFNSHVRQSGIDEPRFLKAYLCETGYFSRAMDARPGEEVRSIFFGGGTPSLMAPETVAAIIDAISSQWRVHEDVEITLEANPSSVEAGRFKAYASAGVNRVSLGVQALDDADLQALGRLHNVREAMTALDIAKSHFGRVSFDLIYARPGQTPKAWEEELSKALEQMAGHLSLYQLTIEPETPFWALHRAGKLKIPEPALAGEFYRVTQDLCEDAGLPAYEISNHARPGEECRHNLIYWNYGDYAGIGPGAHGRLGMAGGRHATSIERNPENWLERVESRGHGISEEEIVTQRQQADEMLLMGLRLRSGVNLRRLDALTGYTIDRGRLKGLIDQNLIELDADAGHLRATKKGRVILNELVLRVSESLRAES